MCVCVCPLQLVGNTQRICLHRYLSNFVHFCTTPFKFRFNWLIFFLKVVYKTTFKTWTLCTTYQNWLPVLYCVTKVKIKKIKYTTWYHLGFRLSKSKEQRFGRNVELEKCGKEIKSSHFNRNKRSHFGQN